MMGEGLELFGYLGFSLLPFNSLIPMGEDWGPVSWNTPLQCLSGFPGASLRHDLPFGGISGSISLHRGPAC
jgi:hypothetical protein